MSYVNIGQHLEGCHSFQIKKVSYENTPLAPLWRNGDCAPKCLLTIRDTYTFIVRINELQLRPFKNFVIKVIIPTVYDEYASNKFNLCNEPMNNDSLRYHYSYKNNFDKPFDKYKYYEHTNNFNKSSIIGFAQHIARESYKLFNLLKEYQ